MSNGQAESISTSGSRGRDMAYKVEVATKDGLPDSAGLTIEKDIRDLGVSSVTSVEVIDLYFLEGDVSPGKVELICRDLFADQVSQQYSVNRPLREDRLFHEVEVAFNPGVMDPVALTAERGIRDLGIEVPVSVRTGKKYLLGGRISEEEMWLVTEKLLLNPVVQHRVEREEKVYTPPSYSFRLREVAILQKEEEELLQLSRQSGLYLSSKEMVAIRDHFRNLGRNPTDVELETIAQTWSEHCFHKTFRGLIDYQGEAIDNLLKSTIMKVTEELSPTWCISVFEDNSGMIKFDDTHNLCFKVETHNHPSAVEPYGGAGTGIGGVIRDPLGTGLGARPIANTDIFCFGPLDYPHEKLPPGVLHPKRVMKGVVAGVRDYGNRMGIPTLNGSIYFDEEYLGNPVVYCGTLGIIPEDKSVKRVVPGDVIVLVGGRTGRDGIHGATYSSGELTETSEQDWSSAVQIGNPIAEKKLVDCLVKARDLGLYKAITDCGGGGLSSAVGEMGKGTGVEVDLEKVPLKYKGLSYTEIWISEAQERMILSAPEKCVDQLIRIFEKEDVEATVIGSFTEDRRLHLKYEGETVGNLDMGFLHSGPPRSVKKAIWRESRFEEPSFLDPEDLTSALLRILSSPNVCSKEWVVRQYDHEVQGGSVLKPLVGKDNDGPGDAALIRPLFDSPRGVILSHGMNPKYGRIDPYWMAASAIDEALRNLISVGGSLEVTALLDNFSWGNPDVPLRLGELVRAARGCYETARVYRTPFISGKDSLNNEFRLGDETISIPPTLLISAVSVVEDVSKAVSMDVKEPGDLVYVVGRTYDELGGSHYYELSGFVGNRVPNVDAVSGRVLMEALSEAMSRGLVRACHDCSEGGIGVACAEMAFAGGLGMEIDLRRVPLCEEMERNDHILFSESNTRFIVEVSKGDQKEFEKTMGENAFGLVGMVSERDEFGVIGLSGSPVVSAKIGQLKEAWQKPLRW